ncbi:MAG: hypothetical protein JXC32_08265 [Anaerolineae bacterium]|nr:hypothetical protein [Anaerolineae bacterium]
MALRGAQVKSRCGCAHRRSPLSSIIAAVVLAVGLFSCATSAPPPTPTAPPPTARPTPTTPIRTPEPRAQLIVCMTEPRAASPFFPSQSGSDLLALFYEEPVERLAYGWEPRLITHLPTLENGEVITRLVTVSDGTRYVDALGFVQTYTRSETVELPQMAVTFALQPGLLWSDGAPITAKDAVLGYHLAQSPEAQGRWRTLAERTAQFTAVDNLTLRWEGLPGYLDVDYAGFLFPLQPAHRWQGQSLSSILDDRTPPATGPFRITAWESKREARLVPNEHYSGAQPLLKEIVVRFPQQDPNSWDGLLVNGFCDIVLPDPILLTSWDQWAQLGAAGEAIVWADAAPVMLRLDMNLDPVAEPGTEEDEDGVSLLEDIEVRRTIRACINRDLLAETMPAEALTPATSFVPPRHPVILQTKAQPYGPSMAGARLRALGWWDEDQDGIHEAHDVPEVEDGTPLRLNLHFASEYFAPAAYVAADLEACGFDIELHPTDRRQLYTVDAASPLFGRTFELALVGWQALVPEVCGAWFSHRIPDEANNWLGENFSGFASAAYDAACERAFAAVTIDQQQQALQEAQDLLDETLPTVFLAWRPFWFAARPEVQGLQPDASAYGTLWNAEELSIGVPVSED